MIFQPKAPVILASASPRRKEILRQLGLNFEIIPAHVDEDIPENEPPIAHVCRLAQEKGRVVAHANPDAYIISSDTIVVYQDEILGKPINEKDACGMLKKLSGNTHEVITAFSIQSIGKGIEITEYDITEVRFRDLSNSDIKAYIESGSPMDKAGAYGIQDVDAYLVDSINGSYHNVIGFPLAHFATVWNDMINQ